MEVEHLARTRSDHAPMFLHVEEENIRRIKTALSKWNKETYGDIFKQLVIREDIIKVKEQLFEEVPNAENRVVLQKAQAKHKKYLHFEKTF
ncbi:hypothetical protein KY289_011516 [Solanum tuberosum]|nr:hypothetical protein KY289_011516 [Solanum tuberosum]